MNQLYPWQTKNWDHLSEYIAQNRIPSGLLISGNKGLGKNQLAANFAEHLLCVTACGKCNQFLLVKAGTNPDFFHVRSEEPGKNISVSQIRNLISNLTLKPQFDAYRVVIVSPADKMNNAAANAFLKCLEEPPERTVIILVTESPRKLPATIISRCQKLVVETPDKKITIDWLSEKLNGKSFDERNIALAGGSPLLALDFINKEILKLHDKCFNEWNEIQNPVIVAEEWFKLTDVPLLKWATSWTINLIKSEHKVESKKLYKLYDLLLESQKLFDTQINKQLMFEEILIKWSEINQQMNHVSEDQFDYSPR